MIKLLTKSSRLITIYLLTVFISGGILTWLSINNISNFKELTENRISAEERKIINNYTELFQNSLLRVADSIDKNLNSSSFDSLSNFTKLKEIDGSFGLLIMGGDGVLKIPRYVSNKDIFNPTISFVNNYQQAEQFEFSGANYPKAEEQYKSTFKWTNSSPDSAKIFNALARLNVKMEQVEEAISTYKNVINNYGLAVNEFGFPYAYFSISQLLSFDLNFHHKDIPAITEQFLQGLLNQTIPFNEYTHSIISEIEQMKSLANISAIDSLCQTVKTQILTVKNFEGQIRNFLMTDDSIHFKPIKSFHLVNALNNKNEYILMAQKSDHAIGFVFNIHTLHDEVLIHLNGKDTRFKYKLSLADADSLQYSLSNSQPVEYSMFSPYFENILIEVKLLDNSEVEKYILRRKLTTLLGLTLLLIAMFLGLFTLIRDVSRKKRIDHMRTDFVSNVTHELKTPLTSINMLADSIAIGTVKKEERKIKYAQTIVKESEKLKLMIDNILEFSRKENDKLNYRSTECDLSSIVHNIMDEMNYWLELNKFVVVEEIQDGVFAEVDSSGIKQVLSNLISNAIKYSPDEKKLVVRLYEDIKHVYIEVEDFGRGIPENQQKMIFEKFYRIRTEVNDTISGTGLGLTVSRDIVESIGGKLLVNSVPGKGSKFIIVLNRKDA